MSDFALTADGDIDLTTRDLVFVTGIEAVRQHLEIRLQFLQGEWIYDEREGVPFLQEIFRKGTSRARILSLIRETIIETPGVSELRELTLDIDKATRTASMSATILGAVDDEPFDFSVAFEVG